MHHVWPTPRVAIERRNPLFLKVHMNPTLSPARKADRAAMAKIISDLARGYGCGVETLEGSIDEYPGPGCTYVKIEAPGGVKVTVELEKKPYAWYLLSWHTQGSPDVKLSPGFWSSINTCHYGKATDVADNFDNLQTVLRHRLTGTLNGSAYQAKQPVTA